MKIYSIVNGLDVDPNDIDNVVRSFDSSNWYTYDFMHKIDSVLSVLVVDSMVTSAEKSILINAFQKIEDAETLSHASAYIAIHNAVDSAQSAIDSLGLNEAQHEGYVAKMTLSAASHSLDYWHGYDPLMGAMPKWVEKDLEAAAVGTAAALAGDLLSGNPPDWQKAGATGLVKGVVASIGASKWFKRIFHT